MFRFSYSRNSVVPLVLMALALVWVPKKVCGQSLSDRLENLKAHGLVDKNGLPLTENIKGEFIPAKTLDGRSAIILFDNLLGSIPKGDAPGPPGPPGPQGPAGPPLTINLSTYVTKPMIGDLINALRSEFRNELKAHEQRLVTLENKSPATPEVPDGKLLARIDKLEVQVRHQGETIKSLTAAYSELWEKAFPQQPLDPALVPQPTPPN